MNLEDKTKANIQTNQEYTPPATLQHGRPVLGQSTSAGASVKKVDKAIHRTEDASEGFSPKKPTATTPHPVQKPQTSTNGTQAVSKPKRVSSNGQTTSKPKTAVSTTGQTVSKPKTAVSTAQTVSKPKATVSKVQTTPKPKASIPSGQTIAPSVSAISNEKKNAVKGKTSPKKTAAKKKAAVKKAKQKHTAGETFMRLGKGLKTGSITVTKYGKKALNMFETFTTAEVEAEHESSGMLFKPLIDKLKSAGKWTFSSFLLLTIVALIVMLVGFNNTSLKVEHVTVSVAGLNNDLEGYTICLLSDMHGREFGTQQATLLRAINDEEYDMMILAGDMIGAKGNAQPLYDLLDGLESKAPVYFIAGDSDPGPLRDKPNVVNGTLEEFVLEEWVLEAIDRGAIYLDSPESLKVDDAIIWLTPGSMQNVESSSTVSALNQQEKLESDAVIAGVPEAYDTLPFTAYRQQNMLELQESILEMEGEDLHISVSHIPPHDPIRTSDGSDGYLPTVDLIVAGHYCGGVWQLPLLGALYIPSVEAEHHGWLPAQNEVEGLRMLGNANLYVTAGLGVTDVMNLPDFRLYNQPRITILHLTAKLTDDLLGLTD